jgi:hypothetical protein
MTLTKFVERGFIEDGVGHDPHSKEYRQEKHAWFSVTSSRSGEGDNRVEMLQAAHSTLAEIPENRGCGFGGCRYR